MATDSHKTVTQRIHEAYQAGYRRGTDDERQRWQEIMKRFSAIFPDAMKSEE